MTELAVVDADFSTTATSIRARAHCEIFGIRAIDIEVTFLITVCTSHGATTEDLAGFFAVCGKLSFTSALTRF